MSDKRLDIVLEDNCIQGDRGELELAEAWAGTWEQGGSDWRLCSAREAGRG